MIFTMDITWAFGDKPIRFSKCLGRSPTQDFHVSVFKPIIKSQIKRVNTNNPKYQGNYKVSKFRMLPLELMQKDSLPGTNDFISTYVLTNSGCVTNKRMSYMIEGILYVETHFVNEMTIKYVPRSVSALRFYYGIRLMSFVSNITCLKHGPGGGVRKNGIALHFMRGTINKHC